MSLRVYDDPHGFAVCSFVKSNPAVLLRYLLSFFLDVAILVEAPNLIQRLVYYFHFP
mgnify:CR=1 FL=1